MFPNAIQQTLERTRRLANSIRSLMGYCSSVLRSVLSFCFRIRCLIMKVRGFLSICQRGLAPISTILADTNGSVFDDAVINLM
jgi:hypothetical protein